MFNIIKCVNEANEHLRTYFVSNAPLFSCLSQDVLPTPPSPTIQILNAGIVPDDETGTAMPSLITKSRTCKVLDWICAANSSTSSSASRTKKLV